MARTNKALLCFWLLVLLALSSEEVGVSDASCFPAVSLGCLKDSNCQKICINDDPDNTSWKCRDFLCICCKDAKGAEVAAGPQLPHAHNYAM